MFLVVFLVILMFSVSATLDCDSMAPRKSCSGGVGVASSSSYTTPSDCLDFCKTYSDGTCCSFDDVDDFCDLSTGRVVSSNSFDDSAAGCAGPCSIVELNGAHSSLYRVIDTTGRELMRIDSDGDIAFSSKVYESITISTTGTDFLVYNSATSKNIFQASVDVGDFDLIALAGSIHEQQSSITYTSSQNFVIKNSLGTTVMKIDPNGNLYTKGQTAEWCDCQSGTYSDPRTLSGNRILQLSTDLGLYADGYCQIVKGCKRASAYSAVTNDANSCRCDKSFGCSSESCTTSTGWKRYSSITCTRYGESSPVT